VNSGNRGKGIWNCYCEERKEIKEKQLNIRVGPRLVPVGGVMALIGSVKNSEPTGCFSQTLNHRTVSTRKT
jgi:hypothetical protein